MRRVMMGLVLVVAASGAGIGISALAKSAKPGADLSGNWRLDREHSDRPGGRGPGWPRMGHEGGGPGPGAWDGRPGQGGWGNRPRRGAGMRLRLPETFRIEQTATLIRIADSTGTVLQEITTGKPGAAAEEAPRVSGHWKDERLAVQRSGPRGGTLTETYSLEDGGRTLVIRTQIEPGGDRPGRELKRVYRRVRAS